MLARTTGTAVLAASTLLLAACGGGSNGGGGTPPASFADRATEAQTIADNVGGVFFTDGPTLSASLPNGSANYTGMIRGGAAVTGGSGGGSGPAISHVADLALTANFDTNQISGTVSNFVTNVTNFENPTGSVAITGTVNDLGANATLGFSGNGDLTGNGVSATYDVVTTFGDFAGTDGSVIGGEHETDIIWLTGPNTGTTSFSDGGFAAERQ